MTQAAIFGAFHSAKSFLAGAVQQVNQGVRSASEALRGWFESMPRRSAPTSGPLASEPFASEPLVEPAAVPGDEPAQEPEHKAPPLGEEIPRDSGIEWTNPDVADSGQWEEPLGRPSQAEPDDERSGLTEVPLTHYALTQQLLEELSAEDLAVSRGPGEGWEADDAMPDELDEAPNFDGDSSRESVRPTLDEFGVRLAQDMLIQASGGSSDDDPLDREGLDREFDPEELELELELPEGEPDPELERELAERKAAIAASRRDRPSR